VDADENAPFAASMMTITSWHENHSAVRDPGYTNVIAFETWPEVTPTNWFEALHLKREFGNEIKLLEVSKVPYAVNSKLFILGRRLQQTIKSKALYLQANRRTKKQKARAEILVLKLVNGTWQTLGEVVVSIFRDYCIVGPWLHDADTTFTAELIKGTRQSHCAEFTRESVCKHVRTVALHLKEVTMPKGIAQFKHSGKRGRGAPKKARGNGRYGSSLFDEDGDYGEEHAEEDEAHEYDKM
jgi:hypothetical protein